MSITVYWTEDTVEHSETLDEPIMAAAVMATVERFDNLTPAGWSWGSDRAYGDVLILRDLRPYTDRPTDGDREAGRPDRGPYVWISVWRTGESFHDVEGKLWAPETACGRVASTTGRGEFMRRSEVESHGMKPCPRCYTDGQT